MADLRPADTPALEWTGYAVRWGQVVTERGIRRPGINTIYDTVQVREADHGMPAVYRSITWRDTEGAWLVFRHSFDAASMRPLDYFQTDNDGDVQALEWRSDGSAWRFVYRASSDHRTWSERRAGSQTDLGFPGSQFGLEFRVVPDQLREGRLLIADGWDDTPSWTEFTVQRAEPRPNLPGINDSPRRFRTASTGLTSDYWLVDRAPYVVGVRFTQENGTTTDWVMTHFELLPPPQ